MPLLNNETQIGKEFYGKRKKMSWERIWTFSGGPFSNMGWPKKNLHTDIEFARNLGLPTVAVSATQYLGHITELMIDLFGEEWLKHGKISNVKFIKMVPEGDTLISKAKVIAKEKNSSKIRFHLNIAVENQYGEKVMVGEANGCIF